MGNDGKPGPDPSVTDEEFLAIFRDCDDPVLSTVEVAEQVSMSRRGVLNRLNDLREKGLLQGKQVGGKNIVWWLPEE